MNRRSFIQNLTIIPFIKIKVTQRGIASWYGKKFRGKITASGVPFDETQYTAAHRTIKLGTNVVVKYLATGISVIVKIVDRGPWHQNRIIDLSEAAAKLIGLVGIGEVEITL